MPRRNTRGILKCGSRSVRIALKERAEYNGEAMRRMKRVLTLMMGVIVMLGLFGCGKQKYTLHFEGYGFESKKPKYAAGEKVTVYYGMIATDTDYSFWLDDENVELKQDYDDRHGYVFTFVMPDHDVTIYESSHNSMMVLPFVDVTFVNQVETADVWILPQTEENLKTSLWGTATIGALAKGEQEAVRVIEGYDGEPFMLRVIDEDHALYSANDLELQDGYTIVFKSEVSKFDAVVQVLDGDGQVVFTKEAFTGVLGAG